MKPRVKYDEPLSNFAFNFKLRRYSVLLPRFVAPVALPPGFRGAAADEPTLRRGLTLVHFSAQLEPFLTQKHTLNTPNTPATA